MRKLWIILAVIAVAGCRTAPNPPKGGSASQIVPLSVEQSLTQPDAPEGLSRQYWEERTTVHSPDGITTIREIKAGTDLGGSQDWAEIVKQYANVNLMRGIVVMLFLGVAAAVAFSTGWPIAGAFLAAGAFSSLAIAWWAGIALAAISMALYVGYMVARAKVI